MEAGPRLHPVTQRPLTAAPADLHRLPADPRSAAGRQAAQAAVADRLTHLRPLPVPGRPQASFEGLSTAWFAVRCSMVYMMKANSESSYTLVGDGGWVERRHNETASCAPVVVRRIHTPVNTRSL